MKKFKKILKKYLTDSNNDSIAEFSKLSFSQSGEDLIVNFIFNEIGIQLPSYIDIGAHHPYYINNTAFFYLKGCRGINIEPDPALFDNLLEERKEDVNLNIGVGEQKDILDFYVINVPTLNTFSKKEAENYSLEGNFYIKEIKQIEVRTVTSILDKYNNGNFPDFLTLDAEGIDEIVLKAIDYDRSKPTVICTETISFSETGRGIKNLEIIKYLESKGYLLYADTNINSIFVLKEKWERI